jgi:hypothetical protein
MIERRVIRGRTCTVAYLAADLKTPASKAAHAAVRIVFDDNGESLVLVAS